MLCIVINIVRLMIGTKHIIAVVKQLRLPGKDWLATLGMKEPTEEPEEQVSTKAG